LRGSRTGSDDRDVCCILSISGSVLHPDAGLCGVN
jgi:hypothetical protein